MLRVILTVTDSVEKFEVFKGVFPSEAFHDLVMYVGFILHFQSLFTAGAFSFLNLPEDLFYFLRFLFP